MVSSFFSQGKLYVNIYGYEKRSPNRKLIFISELIETIKPPPDKTVYDKNVPANETWITLKSQNGYRYELHKHIYENGRLIGKEKINTSTYKPVQGEITVRPASIP